MADRRRLNGPPSGTAPPIFAVSKAEIQRPRRIRKPLELRKIFLKTGLVPSAAGSAYLELELPQTKKTLLPTASTIKLICVVHGPKPLPRNASFSPNLQLTANVKFAPFATRLRRGYIRDSSERGLSSRLETALRGAVIPERLPKSALEVSVTVLEGEDDGWFGTGNGDEGGLQTIGLMNALAGCVTVASAALAHAKIDCLDLLAGGVMATMRQGDGKIVKLLDPCPMEHETFISACAVAYMPSRDEVADVWAMGDVPVDSMDGVPTVDEIIQTATIAARGAHLVLQETIKEVAEALDLQAKKAAALALSQTNDQKDDVEMKT